ncbi:MAG TPA: pyridine nucleotide-disulfide oxidoreductase, partial [Phycisphaerales bacterium]|nr:pyridine nucleotide-disulfide oxidoreductase [Phycisphaerales bacterium]
MARAKRIVIVGGVAGGASCAARARRLSEDAEIVLLERGEHISFANCGMPYHIGGVIAKRDRLLVQTPDGMRKRYRIDVRTRHEAVAIDREAREVRVRNLSDGKEFALPYDVLVLSPGAEPVRPGFPGADSAKVFTLRSLSDMDAIKRAVDAAAPGRAVVVGGGYIGLEMAEALRHRGVEVTLVELAGQVFIAADAEMVAPVHQQLRLHGVDLRLDTSVTAIREAGAGLDVVLSTGETVACGMAILSVGVRPEVKLAREAGLEIGATGGIVVDEHMRTSDPSVFAVGDAVEVTHLVSGQAALIPLAGPANRQGRIAADNILGRPSEYRRTQGTAICKVFDLAIGMTGLSEKELRRLGRRCEKVFVHPASHAGYYPGAVQISLKLLFDPDDGRILGAQCVGATGVDKRIDVLAVAIRAGLTVRDLKDLELSYAPPYGSAKDAVNYAGFVASNVLDGDAAICHVADVLHPRDDQLLLDVRTPDEVEAGTIPGAKNIPIDELRDRLGELPRGREILIFCQVGLRGYVACRILTQNGFACRNLTGGYKTYKDVVGMEPKGPLAPLRELTEDTGEKAPLPPKAPAAGELAVACEIDARALQCPGPILRLKSEMETLADGQAVRIVAADPGFPADVAGWCASTGNVLADVTSDGGAFRATIVKRQAAAPAPLPCGADAAKHKSIVVFSGDFDKAMAAFIIANGA